MKLLEEKIRSEGKALSETVLKVDGFINHQVDPVLMSEIGKTLASYTRIKALPKYLRLRVPVLHRLFTQPWNLGYQW